MKLLEKDGKFYRMRRGKLVEIPPEWVGKTTHPQETRKRRKEAANLHDSKHRGRQNTSIEAINTDLGVKMEGMKTPYNAPNRDYKAWSRTEKEKRCGTCDGRGLVYVEHAFPQNKYGKEMSACPTCHGVKKHPVVEGVRDETLPEGAIR